MSSTPEQVSVVEMYNTYNMLRYQDCIPTPASDKDRKKLENLGVRFLSKDDPGHRFVQHPLCVNVRLPPNLIIVRDPPRTVCNLQLIDITRGLNLVIADIYARLLERGEASEAWIIMRPAALAPVDDIPFGELSLKETVPS